MIKNLIFLAGTCAFFVMRAFGQQSDRISQVTISLPNDAKEALVRASIENAQERYQAAIDILQPYSVSEPHPAIFLFLGEMHERLLEFDAAARAYGEALVLWHQKPPEMPGNIFWKYGRSLLKTGDYRSAQPVLERALLIPGYETDPRVLGDLAEDYRKSDEVNKAYKAALINVCQNTLRDESWDSLREVEMVARVQLEQIEWQSASRPWCPIQGMIQYGRPWNWSTEIRNEAAPAYLVAAEQLAKLHRDEEALRYVVLSSKAITTLRRNNSNYDPNELLTVFDEIKSEPPLTASKNIVVLQVVQSQASKGNFGHAVAALEDAAHYSEVIYKESNNGTDLDKIEALVAQLSRGLFAYVSFDPKTRTPRSASPYEFLGLGNKQGMGDKYGSVSDDEDWANLFAVRASGHGDLNGKDMKLKQIMETCVNAKRLEIPVKILLSLSSIGGNYEEADPDIAGVPLSHIDTAFKTASDGQIRPTTVEAYVLARRLSGISAEVARMKPVALTAVRISPDGSFILVGSADGKGVLWNQGSGTLQRQLDGAEHVAFSSNGRLFLTAYSRKISISSTTDLKAIAELQVLNEIDSAMFLGDSAVLVVASGSAYIYAISSQKLLRKIDHFHGDLIAINCAAISPDGRYLALGTQGLDEATSYKIYIVEAASGKEIATLGGHESTVEQLAFSFDGRYLVSGSDDKTVRLWSVSKWEEVRRYLGHSENISGLAVSQDGKLIAAASWDNSVIVWDLDSGTALHRFEGNGWWFSELAFSPDSQRLFAGSYDGTLKILNPQLGTEITQIRPRPSKAVDKE